MPSPLVETKLHIPRLRRRLVARPRLSRRLGRGAESRLTLLSAPAGFGKTTLLAEWLAATPAEGSVAWLSLEESDRQPASYWTYLITALQQVHLVISTREDPALPLARLRARGELVEVRAADLRFTLDEVAAYLDDITGLELAAGDIAALEGRTEGWIAAFQLAALSMQGRDDVAGFIASFAGDDRYIVDYLVDEVLGRQPARVRGFLLQTSILDRLSGPLCDAVTGQPGGRAMLESLDRANLFLVPLDDSRRWYRCHHLFADVLRTHLLDEQPGAVPGLHRRASQWYEEHREPSPAIRHALAATDVERAAALVELAIPELRRNRQEATIRGWLDAIGDEVVRERPVLAVELIGTLLSVGEFEGVEERLGDAERWLEPAGDQAGAWTAPAGMVVVDQRQFRRLPGAIQMYRAALALSRGDIPATIGHGRRAIDRAADDDHLTRAGASALLGLAFWNGGDLEAAHRAYSAAVEGCGGPGTSPTSSALDHPGRHPDHPGPPGRRAMHLRADPGTRRRPGRDRAAGNGRHGRRDEPDRLRARRPAGRHPAPGPRPGAGRAHLAAAEPLSLAGGHGSGPGGRGRPGRCPRPAGGGAGGVRGRLLPRRPADPGPAGHLGLPPPAQRACGRAGRTTPARRRPPAGQRLVEPLSERELDVLRLLASDLDGPGIARQLTVSLNTLRTHTRNIYAKLGVNSRRRREGIVGG